MMPYKKCKSDGKIKITEFPCKKKSGNYNLYLFPFADIIKISMLGVISIYSVYGRDKSVSEVLFLARVSISH